MFFFEKACSITTYLVMFENIHSITSYFYIYMNSFISYAGMQGTYIITPMEVCSFMYIYLKWRMLVNT